jgi:hypothetical protein
MKIQANPEWMETIGTHAHKSISLNEKRILDGSDEAFVAPAYEDVSDDAIVDFVESLIARGGFTDKLIEIERQNLSKLGPRSIAIPWGERRQSLVDYYENKSENLPSIWEPGDGKLRPTSQHDVERQMLKSTSAGLPSMVRKSLVLEHSDEFTGNYIDDAGKYPCVLFTRTQEQRKTRNVWGYPISDTVWEQLFFNPWLDFEKQLPFRSALTGPEDVDASVSHLLLSKRDHESVYCADFSSYDASVSVELIHQAFGIIAAQYQNQYYDEIYSLFERFVTIPIHTPEGDFTGNHGVPSGSSFTNSIDSLVQYICSGHQSKCEIQGDDGLYIVEDQKVEQLADSFKAHGLKLNEEKSDLFRDPEAIFLQRYYHPEYRASNGTLGGVYAAARALLRIKYLERWTDLERENISGSDYFSLRTITILENCKHHPWFSEVVRFAYDQDKTSLSYTDQGLEAFTRMQQSKARAGLYNQYGDIFKGIHNFEVVKLLMSF